MSQPDQEARSAASTELTDEEVRNAAICLLAADSTLGDGMSAEGAVAFVRRLERSLDEGDLWANGKHTGDCTKEPHTCVRCMFEEAEGEARRRYVGD